jgi:hypothetical protein
LLHELVVSQIRTELGRAAIVQREEREPGVTVPPSQSGDLSGTETAMSIVDHHIRLRSVSRVRQLGHA